MKPMLEAPFIRELCGTASNMYRLGWDERNGGNASLRLAPGEAAPYLEPDAARRTLPLDFDASALEGELFLVTGTGKYFKNIAASPQDHLGIVRVGKGGCCTEILWGFEGGGNPTSELPTHLMNHMARLESDPAHRAVIHCHPANALAMTFVHELDERAFTRTLWRMCTECLVVFPEGVGVLPWMVCGNSAIGRASAEKLRDRRVVLWAAHGVLGTGASLDETFGLIETVEKAAEIYMKIGGRPILQSITDAQLWELARAFRVAPRPGYLDADCR